LFLFLSVAWNAERKPVGESLRDCSQCLFLFLSVA
jgi:hypothetical protein